MVLHNFTVSSKCHDMASLICLWPLPQCNVYFCCTLFPQWCKGHQPTHTKPSYLLPSPAMSAMLLQYYSCLFPIFFPMWLLGLACCTILQVFSMPFLIQHIFLTSLFAEIGLVHLSQALHYWCCHNDDICICVLVSFKIFSLLITVVQSK